MSVLSAVLSDKIAHWRDLNRITWLVFHSVWAKPVSTGSVWFGFGLVPVLKPNRNCLRGGSRFGFRPVWNRFNRFENIYYVEAIRTEIPMFLPSLSLTKWPPKSVDSSVRVSRGSLVHATLYGDCRVPTACCRPQRASANDAPQPTPTVGIGTFKALQRWSNELKPSSSISRSQGRKSCSGLTVQCRYVCKRPVKSLKSRWHLQHPFDNLELDSRHPTTQTHSISFVQGRHMLQQWSAWTARWIGDATPRQARTSEASNETGIAYAIFWCWYILRGRIDMKFGGLKLGYRCVMIRL